MRSLIFKLDVQLSVAVNLRGFIVSVERAFLEGVVRYVIFAWAAPTAGYFN
jgi:hypothetical protein